ncbi:SDR family NAD(P)-dependent oxidoreductase [Gordonia sp. ABSL1-1]|uniref:SDR family NAD(P)-dependent oxidoreductase n=1 Tax=Gordonia sp. ABSL1-1 TaxID=3053923 RepID=UPI0025739B93|nr:SDR family NAD(P)-dependent oxidoreductase [Gordonia sp. ABSL1-1]MDL9937471.1 SDR family NAD(P)-dependent oxidoreductase [Gordonia sp. ABSL1-1]
MRTHRFPDGTTPVVLSADTADLLRAEGNSLADYVAQRSDLTPAALSDMLFRVRDVRRFRAVISAADHTELLTGLRAVAAGSPHPNVIRGDGAARKRKTAMVFPGQGGHRSGMGALYYESSVAFAAEVDRVHEVFLTLFGESPRDYLLGSTPEVDEVAALVQPANFMQMAALAAMWRSFGVVPDMVVGHSQGEIAACYVAGVMGLEDAARIVGARARAVDSFAPDDYAMAVLEADRGECERMLTQVAGWAEVSVINSPGMTGISGYAAPVNEIVGELSDRGRFSRVIAVRYPAHTALMCDLSDAVLAASGDAKEPLAHAGFQDSAVTCIGATLGAEITPDLPADEYWFWNLRNVVRFDRAITRAVELGADAFIELSAHPTLQLPVRETLDVVATRPTVVVGTSNRSATDMSVVTRNLAAVAAGDLGFDWAALQDDEPALRSKPLADFPHTITADTHLWMADTRVVEAPRPAAAPAPTVAIAEPAAPATTAACRTERVREIWVKAGRRSMVAPRTLGVVAIGSGAEVLAGAVVDHAEAFGAQARLLASTADRSDLDAVVVVAAPDTGAERADVGAAVDRVAGFFGDRDWWAQGESRDHWLITVGGEQVLPDDLADVAGAGIAAGFRCLAVEYPTAAFRHLDIGADLVDDGVDTAIARKIVAALHTDRESDLAMRAGDLYVKRLTAADSVPRPTVAPHHALIVGGTGNVGMAFAEYFAGHGTRRITLVGRRDPGPSVAEELTRLRATGAEIVFARCDVTDDGQVAGLAEDLRSLPVDLVIHAAADLPQHAGIELDAIEAAHVTRLCDAKVRGVERILAAVQRGDGFRVLLCSSLAATLGGRATTVYSAANRMLDALAGRLRAVGVDCTSIQWGQWAVHDGTGVAGASALAAVGYAPMPSIEAIEAGLAVSENEIVAAFDWRRGDEVLGGYGYRPLLSGLIGADTEPQPKPLPAAVAAAAPPVPTPVAPIPTPTPVLSDVDRRTRALGLVAGVIGVSDVDAIDTERPLVALGMDSLQALELRRKVTEEFGYELPVTELVGGASLDDVIAMLEEHAPVSTVPTPPPAPPAPVVAAPPVHTPETTPIVAGVSAAQRIPEMVAGVIGVSDVDAIDTARPLVALGMDSLQALELRRKVTEEFGYELPVTELVGGASLDDVITMLGDRSGGIVPPAAPVSSPGAVPVAAGGVSDALAVPTGAPSGATLVERVRVVAEQAVPQLDYRRVQTARVDIDRIGLAAMMTALTPALIDGRPHQADEIATTLGFASRHWWLLRQWLDALAGAGILDIDADGAYRHVRSVPAPVQGDLEKVCAEIGFRPVLADFLRACNDNLIPLGRDTMRVQELLFVGGGTDTADAAYRENLVATYLNRAARATVTDLAQTLGARRTPVRILELGAGVGGTTNDVVAGLSELSVPLDYHFTDVSDFFLSAAREHFALYPWMRFGILDMNEGFGHTTDRYDIVIASNVLHNAHHIGQTLKQLHDLLNPGGAVVIIESTHAYAQLLTSVQFLMSPAVGAPHAGANDVRAGERIFLTEEEWVHELRGAGLTPAVVLPGEEHPLALLDQRVFAAVREL